MSYRFKLLAEQLMPLLRSRNIHEKFFFFFWSLNYVGGRRRLIRFHYSSVVPTVVCYSLRLFYLPSMDIKQGL